MLRNYCDQEPSRWDCYLGPAEFAINNSKSKSTGFSPFYLNYGYHPRTPMQLELGDTVPAAKDYMDSYMKRLSAAKTSLQAAQDSMKQNEDRKR